MAFDADSIRGDNICVIWVDDMIDVFTWRTTFGLRIQTPNLDRLLNRGVRFGNAYATIPLCAPCRGASSRRLRLPTAPANRTIWRTSPRLAACPSACTPT